jgi:hypothetical protein
MSISPPRDLAERLFDFACDVVTYSRELSKESGVVRNIAWQLSDAATSAAANYQEAKLRTRGATSRQEIASFSRNYVSPSCGSGLSSGAGSLRLQNRDGCWVTRISSARFSRQA